jgi:hypothetical protein
LSILAGACAGADDIIAVRTAAALVDHAIAVIVDSVAADFSGREDLADACSPLAG